MAPVPIGPHKKRGLFPFDGVAPKDFSRTSHLHGHEHVNRVMCLGQLIGPAIEIGLGRRGWFGQHAAPLWAATYLHDLARECEGVCHQHGRWAVEQKLPGLVRWFHSKGVRTSDIPAIATATEFHSREDELPRDNPHWELTALLKDADALDRCRLGFNEQADCRFLRFPETQRYIPIADELFLLTQDNLGLASNIQELWKALLTLSPR